MQISKLAEAIEHMETAKELLRLRKQDETPLDDDVHGAIMSLGFYVNLLTNDLAKLERETLANYKRANTACTPTGGDSPASEILPTGEVTPSNQVEPTPPTSG